MASIFLIKECIRVPDILTSTIIFQKIVAFNLDFKSLHLALHCLKRQIGNDLLTDQCFKRINLINVIQFKIFDLISIDIECISSNHYGALFSISHIWY